MSPAESDRMMRTYDAGPADDGVAARDTRLAHEGRLARQKRMRTARRRRLAIVSLLVVGALATGGWLVARSLPGDAVASLRRRDTEPRKMAEAAIAAPAEKVPDPTPLFATYRDIAIRVPVPNASLIDIAFHQASFSYAQHLVTTLPTYATDDAAKKRGTGRTVATNVPTAEGWLQGSVLRLWRDRPGKPDSAADVGAAPGTPVLAPITGTVLLVKPYKLYSKYDDVQIHIRPDGHEDLDLVMIHVTDPTVVAGDRVFGGVTQVGAIRKLSHKMHLQLSDFTPGSGDHVHLQVNKVKPGTTEAVTGS